MARTAPDADTGERPPTPASWFTIVSLIIVELVVAAAIALAVSQLYIAYECGAEAYRQEHVEQCRGGFPYPLS